MKIQGNKIIAEEGKLLRRKVAFPLTASTITLGKVLIDGKMVDDVPENYEEIDKSEVIKSKTNLFEMLKKNKETVNTENHD